MKKGLLFGFLGILIGVVLTMFINIYGLKITNVEQTEDGQLIEIQVLFLKNYYYFEYDY